MSANLARNYDPDLALRGGRWVNVRGIMRWQGARPADEPDPERTILSDDETRVCLTCQAGPRDTCRNARGERVSPHKQRLIPRQCQCGEVARPGRPTCATCQAKVAEQQLIEARERQAARDAALLCPHGHHQGRTPTGGLLACKTCDREKRRQTRLRAQLKQAS